MRIQTIRCFLFFLLILCLLSLKGLSQMRQVYLDSDPDNEISKVSFYSPSQGYVAFWEWVGFTTDSGRTFTKKYITLTNVDYSNNPVNLTFGFVINGVKAFNQNDIIVYGHYGLVPSILASGDGGNTFKLVYHSQFDPMQLKTGIMDMVFPQNGNIGYAVDADRVLKTVNRGLTWAPVFTTAQYFSTVDAIDDNTLFAITTTYNRIWKSTNGGSTWSLVFQPAGQLKHANFLTSAKGWVNVENTVGGAVYYTSNGGSNWTLKNNPAITSFSAEKLKFINDSTGFALVDYFKVYKTSDSGKVWEPVGRDNDFTHLGYSHYDLQFWNNTQMWAGGGHGLVELNTDPLGAPLPKAYFAVDTTNMYVANVVNLKNYSKTNYQYKWYVNSVLVGTGYNASYVHDIYLGEDTVKLVVINGTNTDTLVQYPQFNAVPYPPPTVSSFTPTSGGSGTFITITGDFFANVSSVKVGGIPVSSFTVHSLTHITATLGAGGNGGISVTSATGTGFKTGYIFFPPPVINSFAPLSGPIGTTVTINGNNFDPSPGGNIVYFGSVKASVLSASANQLTVTVPVGTMYAPISVVANKHLAHSSLGFIVTFPGNCGLSAYNFEKTKIFQSESGFGSLPAIVISDLDGDGKNDVITPATHGIGIIRNTGSPGLVNFSTAIGYPTDSNVYPAYSRPGGLAAGDLDGDGKPDLVVTNTNTNSISFFKNTSTPGLISFANKIDIPHAGRPAYVSIGDLDGDGKYDLAIINSETNLNKLSVYRNISINGNISFDERTDIGIGIIPEQVHIGDLDGDAKPDLFVLDGRHLSNPRPNTFSVFKNTSSMGNISFAAPQLFDHYGYAKRDANLADIDNDGRLDITIVYEYQYNVDRRHAVAVFRNTSSGGNISLAPPVPFDGCSYAQTIGIGDLDGDGKLDMSSSCSFFSEMNLHKNNSTPGNISLNFTMPISSYYMTGGNISRVADMDGDGKADLVDSDYGSIYIHRNTQSERGALAGKDTTICSGQSIMLGGLHDAQQHTYSWTSNPSGFTSTLANVRVSPLVSTSYYVAVTNPQGCISYDTINVTVGGPAPVVNAGPDRYGCSGIPIQIGTAAIAPNTYSWSSIPAGFSSTDANPFVTSSGGTISYILSANTGSCIAKDTVRVDIYTPPIASAGADKTVCGSSGASIGSQPSGSNVYSWTSSPAGFTSTSSNPIVTPTVTTTYFMTVTNSAGCIGRDTVVITAINAPVADAGPDKLVCTGNSVVIGTAASAGYTYNWQSSPFGFLSQQAMPSVSPTATTDYIVFVSNGFCFVRDTVRVIVNSNSNPAVTITASNTNICTAQQATFTASDVNGGLAPSYQWQVNGVNTGTNSKTFTTNTLNHNDQVKVLLTSNSPCVSTLNATSNIISMNVSPPSPPSVAITASNTTICPNGQAVFTATPVNGGSSPSYQWKMNGANVGSNNNTYRIFPSTVVPDGSTIQVIMTSNSACASPITASSNIVTMTLSQGIAANAGRDTITCAGTGVLIGTPAEAGYTYSWSPNIWLNSPSSAQTIANPPGTINYYLRVSTAGDACTATDTVVVTVTPLPSPPSISQSGFILTASSSPGYQWYRNNVPIPNANSRTFTASSDGTYTVRAVFNGCLSAVSNVITVVITAVNDPVLDRQAQITPNPVHDKLYINPGSSAVFDLILLDVSGIKIFTKTGFRNALEVDMKKYASGTYIVRLVDKSSGKHVQRIIIKL